MSNVEGIGWVSIGIKVIVKVIIVLARASLHVIEVEETIAGWSAAHVDDGDPNSPENCRKGDGTPAQNNGRIALYGSGPPRAQQEKAQRSQNHTEIFIDCFLFFNFQTEKKNKKKKIKHHQTAQKQGMNT